MVIFIDESGIHKQTGHATSAVVYIEVKNLEKFENKLKKIETDLRISFFHWAEERWLMKNKFLSRIFELDFTVADALASLIRYYHDNPEEKDAKKWFNKLKRDKKLSFELLVNQP